MSNSIRSVSPSAFVYIQPIDGVNAQAVSQFIPNNAETEITIWQFPSGGGFNTGLDMTNGRYEAPQDGFYFISADIVFDSNSTGFRTAIIIINNANIVEQRVRAVNGDETHVKVRGGSYFLGPGDFISIRVVQDSGGVLAVTSESNLSILRTSKNV